MTVIGSAAFFVMAPFFVIAALLVIAAKAAIQGGDSPGSRLDSAALFVVPAFAGTYLGLQHGCSLPFDFPQDERGMGHGGS